MKTRCGETDNPSYLALADEPSRLLIDRLVLEVLCNPPHETKSGLYSETYFRTSSIPVVTSFEIGFSLTPASWQRGLSI